MPNNKRGNLTLFTLLNQKPLDGKAVIDTAQRKPIAATLKYKFPPSGDIYYPLHQAVVLGANIDVVEAIYNSYPNAIREKCEDCSVLRLSISCGAPTEVVLFVISKWPAAVKERAIYNSTPLHRACFHGAPYEVLTLLLNVWPGAARERNNRDETPLHVALQYTFPSVEKSSLLIEQYPGALKEKNCHGRTPLHCAACHLDIPLNLILFLLQKRPEAIMEKDNNGMTPYAIYSEDYNTVVKLSSTYDSTNGGSHLENDRIRKVLSSVRKLYNGDNLNIDKLKGIMTFFIRIEWWAGIELLLDKYPTFVMKCLDIDLKLFPQLFFLIGQRCMMKTLWKFIRNKLDIIEGI